MRYVVFEQVNFCSKKREILRYSRFHFTCFWGAPWGIQVAPHDELNDPNNYIRIEGIVLDKRCRPITNAEVEIWYAGGNPGNLSYTLKDTIFETDAYGVPSKSQNPTVLGLGGPSSDLAMWCQIVSIGTKLPNHKWMDLLKKVIDMNLLFFNNKFFILNKVFDTMNF